jgi:hypothetical protein
MFSKMKSEKCIACGKKDFTEMLEKENGERIIL